MPRKEILSKTGLETERYSRVREEDKEKELRAVTGTRQRVQGQTNEKESVEEEENGTKGET